MKKYIAIIVALLLVLPSQARRRPLNEEKKINEIWARTDMPEFNDFTVKEKYKNEPIIFLAKYDEFIALKRAIITGNEYPITITKLSRCLVKINDNRAIKSISEIEYQNYSQTQKSVVGIRIHKQDGTLVELNPNDYIKVGTNLKGKNTKRNVSKIAVPNLQKGDIVDYFIYQELDMFSSRQFEYQLNDFAPIQRYRFHGDMTTPYFNLTSWYWLPSYIKAKEINDKDKTHLDFELTDIDKQPQEVFNAPYRDEPRLKIWYNKFVSGCSNAPLIKKFDRINRMTKQTEGNKINGIMENHAYYYSKIHATTLKEYKKFYNRTFSYLKKYLAQHPNLSEKQIADEVYNYLCFARNGNNISIAPDDFWTFFSVIITKLGITRTYGIVNNRYVGNWENRLFEDTYNSVIKLKDGTCYYPCDYSLPCAIDQPSIYEGMEAIMIDAANKPLKYKYGTDYNKLTRKKIDITPANKNRSEYVINATLDDTDINALNIDRTVSILGTNKIDIRKDLGTFLQWDSIMRKHFNITQTYEESAKENGMDQALIDRFTSYFELEPYFQEKAFECEAEEYFNNPVKKLQQYSIKSYGLFADQPLFTYTSSTKVGEMVRTSSNSKIVSIGYLLKNIGISALRKERKSNIVFNSTSQVIYKISLNIPNGYKVENLSTLESAVTNKCGLFSSTAKVENDKLVLSVEWDINDVEYPAQDWNSLLEIFNAYDDFYNKSVVLSK